RQPASEISPAALIARLNEELRAVVHAVNRLTPAIVEVVVRAPMAVRAFRPGQFYRLQNYEMLSRDADGTRLAKEGLALTGAAIVWCCDEAPGFRAERAQDKAFVGDIVTALDAYASGALGKPPIPLGEIDRVIAIGSDGMMAAVSRARQGMLGQHFKPGHKAI